MNRLTPFHCSVGLHRWQQASYFGLGATPVRSCSRCPSRHILYWGGAELDVMPAEHRIVPLSQQRWFHLLSSLTAGSIIGLACGVFLIPLISSAVGAPMTSSISSPALLGGALLGGMVGLVFAALRRVLRHHQ